MENRLYYRKYKGNNEKEPTMLKCRKYDTEYVGTFYCLRCKHNIEAGTDVLGDYVQCQIKLD